MLIIDLTDYLPVRIYAKVHKIPESTIRRQLIENRIEYIRWHSIILIRKDTKIHNKRKKHEVNK